MASGPKVIGSHDFTSGIPTPGGETVHLDFYEFHHSQNIEWHPAEVVIERFEYLPWTEGFPLPTAQLAVGNDAFATFGLDEEVVTALSPDNHGGIVLTGIGSRSFRFHNGKFETIADAQDAPGLVDAKINALLATDEGDFGSGPTAASFLKTLVVWWS
jgi:hypothetical protein